MPSALGDAGRPTELMPFRLFSPATRRRRPRVALIGLDGADPSLVFDRWATDLRTLSSLRRRGLWGELESVVPPDTVTVWSCMMTGEDPGSLGVYGPQGRTPHPDAGPVAPRLVPAPAPRLWDILAGQGRAAIVLGLPAAEPAAPPAGRAGRYVAPPELDVEVEEWPRAPVDGGTLRIPARARLLEQVCVATRNRFDRARQLLQRRPWDLFVLVETGTGIIQSAFWKELDPSHPGHDPGSPFRSAISEYFRYVDREIGSLLEALGPQTHVLIVSGYGCRPTEGAFCLNEWLIREGYLVLAREPDLSRGPVRLDEVRIDWSRTRAWGEGGPYGRIFINLQGRQLQGIVDPAEYEALRRELATRLEAMEDETGRRIGTRCFRPQEIYESVQGEAPDLIVYAGNLAWRVIDTVGWDRRHLLLADAGRGNANPAQHGLLIYSDLTRKLGGWKLGGVHLLQIAPTVLHLLGLPIPAGMPRPPISLVVDRRTNRAPLVFASMGRNV